jgi:hypothetical protein
MAQFPAAMAEAVKFAENNKKNHGVLSVKTSNPSEVVRESVANNLARFNSGRTPAPWIQERPSRFVDFMQRRWAPIGAENDPNNLNANWAPNVRYYLQRQYPEQYEQWRQQNLVQSPLDSFNAGVA